MITGCQNQLSPLIIRNSSPFQNSGQYKYGVRNRHSGTIMKIIITYGSDDCRFIAIRIAKFASSVPFFGAPALGNQKINNYIKDFVFIGRFDRKLIAKKRNTIWRNPNFTR